MKKIHCPKCKKRLFDADFCDVEIACGSCKRIVRIKFYSAKHLLLTSELENDSIETEERS